MKRYSFLLLIPVAFLLQGGCSMDSSSYSSSGSSSSGTGNSTAGSLARFVLVGNYLYTINQQTLKTFNVSNPANPTLESTVEVGFGIETIFPYKNYLYIGSSTVAYQYSISNPGRPAKTSQVSYFIPGRDPIVANDTVAYSTVRNTASTGGTLNVINVRNPGTLTITTRLLLTTNPYGLGLADTALYVCEHSAGIKVYSIAGSLANNPAVRKIVSNSETYYDVISSGNLLYAWIEGGNSIFDISSRMNPVLLSKTKN